MGDPTMSEKIVTQAESVAAGLRRLAGVIDANPGLAAGFHYYLQDPGLSWSPLHGDADQKSQLAAFTRAFLAAGASIEKSSSEAGYFYVKAALGGVTVQGWAYRDQVCERVVIDTETVTKTVKDPEALAAVPEIEVTETRDIVEWKCSPLLEERAS